jgi:hypothetical protein
VDVHDGLDNKGGIYNGLDNLVDIHDGLNMSTDIMMVLIIQAIL